METAEKPARLLMELPVELHDRLKREAARRSSIVGRVSMAMVVRELISEHIPAEG